MKNISCSSTEKIDMSIATDGQDSLQMRLNKILSENKCQKEVYDLILPDTLANYSYRDNEEESNYSLQVPGSGTKPSNTERRQRQPDRRKAEAERIQSAARFQTFVEQLPSIPYLARLEDGCIIYISPKIEELVGFTVEQWCNDSALRFKQLHPGDRASVVQSIKNAIDTKGSYSVDYRLYCKNGSLRWIHDEACVMTSDTGTPLFLQGTAFDITDRKQAQMELEKSHCELKELIAMLDALRLEEQKRLAHEMHDDFGQLLAAMKIDLAALGRYLPRDNLKIGKHLSSLHELVDTMVISIRRIVADLPPRILEDFGLFEAVQLMVQNFETRHQIDCHLHRSAYEPMLEIRTASAVYRIVQEALNNIAKHAHATCAEIHIYCETAGLTLRVRDNGQGMEVAKLAKSESLGLVGIRERTIALGGEVKIESTKGKGTLISVVIPLDFSTSMHLKK